MSDDRIAAIISRGRAAGAVLSNETVVRAFDYITERLQAEWRSTAAAQAQHREALFHQIAGLDAVRAQLKQWADAAKFEQARLDKAEERRPRR
jgi:hypothetical protein